MANVFDRWFGVLLFAWLLAFATTANAADCTPQFAKIVSVQGEIEVKRAGTSDWHPVNRNEVFCPGDSIRVGEQSRAAIVMANETLLRLDQNSAIKFSQFETELPSILEFIKGIGHFISRVPRSLKIETATVDAAIEGTEFVVAVSTDETSVTVFEGTVLTRNQQGELLIVDGETAVAKANMVPQKTLLAKPRDIVQWAVYFPPVIERDAPDNVSRASQLLSVGRVEEAQDLLQGIDSGEALALQTLIAIVNNEQERAFNFATDAVKRAPQSAAAHIAMSYAWQAKLDLDQALASARQAVEYEPDDAIAWARLAELQLGTGELREALASAQQAIQQDAKLSRTQSILGFAYLARIDIDEAMAAFESAIELDQVDPLPRLGLGLARIRKSNLDEGRRELEIATSLDPNNAIIRSYLGKAYFDEKRAPLDAEQFAISKELDPNDPTPYFYDAIRRQTENDPVGALENLNRSIELNDNRAVYRSRLRLDGDRAVRGASLARIYDDLGFDRRGQLEASRSLDSDRANHSAHRFLSDTYARRPRHEIARVSELLQAQLLQPINIAPVQPQLAITDLNIVSGAGPAVSSFNEYNSLFERNRLRLLASGVYGNNNTWGNEAVLSGIYDRFSYSLGQFHYETDGYRENNDLAHDIYNLFGQFAITPKLNLQAEYRSRETDHGDLGFKFNREEFDAGRRDNVETDTSRLGLNYAVSSGSNLLFSYIGSDRDRASSQTAPQGASIARANIKEDGNQFDGQYIWRQEDMSVLVGLLNYDFDVATRIALDYSPQPCPFPSGCVFTDDVSAVEQSTAYIYSNINYPRHVWWTLGVSYDSYDDEDIGIDTEEFNPKVGVSWDIDDHFRFRFAYFEQLKRRLLANQTLEPTHVAGFNQFYDDFNGSTAEVLAFGADYRPADELEIGIEAISRDLNAQFKLPSLQGEDSLIDERRAEDVFSAYLFWIPHPFWAVRTEFAQDNYRNDDSLLVNEPVDLETSTALLGIRYFYTTGISLGVDATYIEQEVTSRDLINGANNLPAIGPDEMQREDFVVLDAAVRYRFPKRFGEIALEVNNLLDEEFNYQSDNFRSTVTQAPRYIPDRSVLVRVVLNI